MKFVSLAEAQARLSAYVEQCETEGLIIVTRNGKVVAVLLAPRDPDDLERIVLARSPRFQALLTTPGVLGQEQGHWVLAQSLPDLERELPAPRARHADGPSREGVARHRVLVPNQPEPGPARGDHAVNRQQPFSQNGACNVQIFKPGSRRRDGHHMRARLDKGVV
jgi:prevent-host-death family protein